MEKGLQLRNRTFLRQASSSSSGKCLSLDPHLEESRPCDKACFFRYEWSFTAWSSCQPVGDASCGEGKRQRGTRCLRLGDGRPVRDNLCDQDKRPRDHELETWCPTDCPIGTYVGYHNNTNYLRFLFSASSFYNIGNRSIVDGSRRSILYNFTHTSLLSSHKMLFSRA